MELLASYSRQLLTTPMSTGDVATRICAWVVMSRTELYDWRPVDKAVANVRNEGRALIEHINHPLL
jgi:hypothetical protein